MMRAIGATLRHDAAMLIFAALTGGTAAGCRHEQPEAPPVIVVSGIVHARDAATAGQALRYPVEAAARYSNSLSFRVGGLLIERSVRLGDPVHKGQVIARLDSIDAQKQAASAQAAADAAEHRLTYAKQQLDRDLAQSAQNLIAANQLEQTQDAYATALAQREQAVAQRVIANNTLQYNSLSVEHDGVITSENADTGQVVSAGQAIYGLAWTGDMDVVLDAAASDVGRIAVGQSASITFPALPDRSFESQVRELAPSADPQSRTYRVKLTLLHPGKGVRFGMTGDAALSPMPAAAGMAAAGAIDIPATALFHQGSIPAVWVIRPADSLLELRKVSVLSYGEQTVTLRDGLKEGERIVFAGVHTVYAGERVQAVAPLFAADGAESGSATNAGATGAATRVADGAGASRVTQ